MGLLKSGCPLLIKAGGITKLSGLVIDADKNWQGKGISNLEGVAAGMAKGDLSSHDGLIMAILNPGPSGTVLHTGGPGADPYWDVL